MIHQLDIRTLIFVATLIHIAVALLAVLLTWGFLNTNPSTRFWTTGFIFRALGFSGICFRDSLPDFISQPVANTLCIAGSLMFLAGARHFTGYRPHLKRLFFITMAILLIFYCLTYGQESYNLRVVAASLAMITIDPIIAWQLVRTGKEIRSQQNLLACVFLVEAGLMICRSIAALTGPQVKDVFANSALSFIGFVPLVVIPFCIGFGFLSMINARAQNEKEKVITELEKALVEIKTLSGLLPICAQCKKIRTTNDEWQEIEVYLKANSQAEFTHGICPNCEKRFYEDIDRLPAPPGM